MERWREAYVDMERGIWRWRKAYGDGERHMEMERWREAYGDGEM